MAVQRGTLNGAVLNGAALVVVYATATLAGAGSVSAPAFRNTPITATAAGAAAIPYNTLWQQHAARANGIQPAALYAFSSVKKPAAASATTTASLTARHMPALGGAELDATATFGPAAATLVQPGQSVGTAHATLAAEAYRWVWSNAAIPARARLIAEPGIKLNGDSFWTFEASATQIGQGAVSFAADGIRIVAYDAVFAGHATWSPAITYKRRVAAIAQATTGLDLAPRQRHNTQAHPATGTATAQATGTRYAQVQAAFNVVPTLAANGKGRYSGAAQFTLQTAVQPNATRVVFHGYPVLSATSDLSVVYGPNVHVMAHAEPLGWASATMTALVNIRSLDVVTVLRPAELRDFSRSPETRDFYRSAT